MGLNSEYAALLRQLVTEGADLPDTRLLGQALILTTIWRSKLWTNTLAFQDTRVRSGPFAGMDYNVQSAEGAQLPRLLGLYERELHPDLIRFAGERLEAVVDIGCAEGYYAVGLARMMPDVTVYAHDIDPIARRRCGMLAKSNDVVDRVIVGEVFEGADFERFRGQRTLIFIDAEGIENELLDPDLYPALREMSVIVETHPMARPGVTERLISRFEPSHDVFRLDPALNAAAIDPAVAASSHLDMMLAACEWRAGPTPWLVMRPHGWSS